MIIEAIVLGIVQGLTEFFPISSSAHLIFIPFIFKWRIASDSLSFDVALHLGSLMALIIYFRQELIQLIIGSFRVARQLAKNKQPNMHDYFYPKLGLYIFIAVLPIIIFGYFFADFIDKNLRTAEIAAINLIIFAVILFGADKIGVKKLTLSNLTITAAFLIGLFQALSIVPGVSRSAITIAAALLLGLNRVDAARYSFLLAIPTIAAAGIYQLYQVYITEIVLDQIVFLSGILSSFVASYLAISILLKLVIRGDYKPFVLYRIIVGIIILLI